jgi:hypothetical protein
MIWRLPEIKQVSFNKLVTAILYEEFFSPASLHYHKPLYAKHKNTHPSKVGEGFIPDAVLGARSRFQFTSYL